MLPALYTHLSFSISRMVRIKSNSSSLGFSAIKSTSLYMLQCMHLLLELINCFLYYHMNFSFHPSFSLSLVQLHRCLLFTSSCHKTEKSWENITLSREKKESNDISGVNVCSSSSLFLHVVFFLETEVLRKWKEDWT